MKRTNKRNKKLNIASCIIPAIVFVAVLLLGSYLAIPRAGWSSGILLLVSISSIAAFVAFKIVEEWEVYYLNETPKIIILAILVLSVLAILISCLVSWQWFHVDEARARIDIQTISQENLMNILPDVNDKDAYSWADSVTARKLAARKTGELTELISLYSVSDDVTTTVTNGTITKYLPLEYSGFFKAMKTPTIPGYIKVDPVTQRAEYVEYDICYSPSAYFSKDLMRHVRNNFPSDYLGYYTFQVDPDGTPWWVVSLMKAPKSWFVKEVYAIALVDVQTGVCTKYELDDVPEWVTAIHGNDAASYYNAWGRYVNGYWNLSNLGETATTDDFGYVNINNTLYYYTGVTSVVNDGKDESNLGVLLYNSNTREAYYCQTPGAEEHSAMEAAQGVVQNFGYVASFPSLTSVDGELTYTMVLKDDNGIVKQYAMVNYKNYTIAAVGETLSACRVSYKKALSKDGIIAETDSLETMTITVDSIEYIVQGGETTVYIKDTNGNVYKSMFDEKFLFVSSGDELIVSVVEATMPVKTVTVTRKDDLVPIEDYVAPEETLETIPSVESE